MRLGRLHLYGDIIEKARFGIDSLCYQSVADIDNVYLGRLRLTFIWMRGAK